METVLFLVIALCTAITIGFSPVVLVSVIIWECKKGILTLMIAVAMFIPAVMLMHMYIDAPR